jgi:hypothetical protein
MTVHYGVSIDPGLSSGACVFTWGDSSPLKIIKVWQISDGAVGLAEFLDGMGIRVGTGRGMTAKMFIGKLALDAMVVEKFTPRVNEGFSHTRASVEPLRGEGVLIGRGFDGFIQWAEPSQQYFMGGEGLKAKKKSAREFLKLHGMYVTGKDVGRRDADDAISATLHAVSWLRRKRHMPTIEALFKEKGEQEWLHHA